MKFLKLSFSKLVFVGLSIIFQIIFFIATNFYLSESFWWVNDLFSLLSVLLFFVIINKDKPSSFKLPWIVIILLFPIIFLVKLNFHINKRLIAQLIKPILSHFKHGNVNGFPKHNPSKNIDDFRPNTI